MTLRVRKLHGKHDYLLGHKLLGGDKGERTRVNVASLQVQRDGCAALERVAPRVLHHAVGLGVRLPDVLRVVVVLRRHNDLVGDQEGGVESHPELADQIAEFGGAARLLRYRTVTFIIRTVETSYL
jgi:hypothetical protein